MIDVDDTRERLGLLRQQLEKGFSPETAQDNVRPHGARSTGQCAAVSIVVREVLGGRFASTMSSGQSHWFNRIEVNGALWDVDLTGDQIGGRPVQIAPAGSIYPSSRERSESDLCSDVIQRAILLARRSELKGVLPALESLLEKKHLMI